MVECSTIFWHNFYLVSGTVLGLMPLFLLAGGTIALALQLHHRRVMVRLASAREALNLPLDGFEADSVRREARQYLRSGY